MRFSKRRRRVVIEIQGDHNVYPPEAKLEETVTAWLNRLKALPKEEATYRLQVERWRSPTAHGFTGVKVVCVPDYNPSSVMIWVRPSGEQHQWKCHLICPSSQISAMIFCQMRPEAADFLDRYGERKDQIIAERRKDVQSTHPNLAERKIREHSRVYNEIDRLKGMLVKRSMLRKLCGAINAEIEQDKVTAALLRRIIPKKLDRAVNDEAFDELLCVLVAGGIIEPVDWEDDERFITTPLFLEYAEDFAETELQQKLEGFESRHRELSKLLDHANRELARTMARAEKEKESIESLTVQLRDVEQTIASLRGTDSENVEGILEEIQVGISKVEE